MFDFINSGEFWLGVFAGAAFVVLALALFLLVQHLAEDDQLGDDMPGLIAAWPPAGLSPRQHQQLRRPSKRNRDQPASGTSS